MGRKLSFDPETVRALVLDGVSDADIARKLGAAQTRISDWRRRNGLPMYRRCWACDKIFEAVNAHRTHCGECGLRKCSRCKEIKATECFSANSLTPDGINNVCKACVAQRALPHHRRYGLKARYGLSSDDLVQLWEEQGKNCAICKFPLSFEDIRVDHDASHCERSCRACVRGLAHHGCNVGIGFFGESPKALRNAAAYCERWKESGGAGEAFHAPPNPNSRGR